MPWCITCKNNGVFGGCDSCGKTAPEPVKRPGARYVCSEAESLELILLLQEWYEQHEEMKTTGGDSKPSVLAMGMLYGRCREIFDA